MNMTVMRSTQQVQDLFKPLLGQVAWSVGGGVGSMLTLEFGAPHIIVREPKVPNRKRSERVRRLFARRLVTVRGDWHLWIQYCDWKISVSDGSCDSESFDWRHPDECLRDLDGQRLVSVGGGALPNSWKFAFDLGGVLEVWPSTEYKPTNDLWGLYRWDNEAQNLRFIVSAQNDGMLDFENAWHE
jgi:hypothetical protein